MSDYEREEGQGALFVNDKKEVGSNQPDYTGVVKVGGREQRIAGWKRESKGGKTYLSIKVSEFLEKKPEASYQETLADEVPF
jgi:uncharacterized protein (DUF736 family)